MESDRWKKASLAINAIIRGLELDQVVFQYDEAAGREVTRLAVSVRELPPFERTTTGAYL